MMKSTNANKNCLVK